MSTPARQRPQSKPRKARRPPLVYVVEVAPVEPDPKVAAQVLAWLRARVR